MTREQAQTMIEAEGYNVSDFVEEDGETFVFNCTAEDGETIEVCVVDGHVLPSPT